MPRLKWRFSKIIGPKTFFACMLVSLIWALLPADPHKWANSTSVQAANSAVSATGAARKTHSPPKPGELRQLTIKELGNFEYDAEDKSASIPADVQALEGMSVRLQGFMIPTDQAQGVSHFVLVPSLFSCCYGQPPGVQHVIEVTCTKGMTVPFEVVEIYAQGTLHVKEKHDGSYVVSLFALDCTNMKRVQLDFKFLDPGPLIDRDLELVAPAEQFVDDLLTACAHPLTRLQSPIESRTTRQQVMAFLASAPQGHEPPQADAARVAQYHFWMRLRDEYVGAVGTPAIRHLGGISLRIGSSEAIQKYYGNFGYHVMPAARGRHFAQRACRLLLPLARQHGLQTVWITCNPDNFASRTTCEHLGAKLIEIVAVPESDPLFARGEHFKCRYRIDR